MLQGSAAASIEMLARLTLPVLPPFQHARHPATNADCTPQATLLTKRQPAGAGSSCCRTLLQVTTRQPAAAAGCRIQLTASQRDSQLLLLPVCRNLLHAKSSNRHGYFASPCTQPALTQQEPQAPWFFTPVTAPLSLQSTAAGGFAFACLNGVGPRFRRLQSTMQRTTAIVRTKQHMIGRLHGFTSSTCTRRNAVHLWVPQTCKHYTHHCQARAAQHMSICCQTSLETILGLQPQLPCTATPI
jgi:hypothetical protein